MRRFNLDVINKRPEKKDDQYLFKDNVGNVVLVITHDSLLTAIKNHEEELNYFSKALELLKRI
jgi:hypothetical protein